MHVKVAAHDLVHDVPAALDKVGVLRLGLQFLEDAREIGDLGRVLERVIAHRLLPGEQGLPHGGGQLGPVELQMARALDDIERLRLFVDIILVRAARHRREGSKALLHAAVDIRLVQVGGELTQTHRVHPSAQIGAQITDPVAAVAVAIDGLHRLIERHDRPGLQPVDLKARCGGQLHAQRDLALAVPALLLQLRLRLLLREAGDVDPVHVDVRQVRLARADAGAGIERTADHGQQDRAEQDRRAAQALFQAAPALAAALFWGRTLLPHAEHFALLVKIVALRGGLLPGLCRRCGRPFARGALLCRAAFFAALRLLGARGLMPRVGAAGFFMLCHLLAPHIPVFVCS